MEHTICHFEIPADDLEAARKFYAALFDWSIEPAPHLAESYLLIRTSKQPGAVMGALPRRAAGQQGVTLYFTVESVEESAKKLTELGGTILQPKTAVPKLGWAVVGRDPQGNCIGLFQEDPSAA